MRQDAVDATYDQVQSLNDQIGNPILGRVQIDASYPIGRLSDHAE